jgi:ribosome-binding factor A
MANRRSARLNEQLKREISEILRRDVRDPRIGLPTVTEADVTQDLWLARIYVRPSPTDAGRDVDEMIEGLTAAAPFVRRELGRALGIRRVPELRFLVDRTLEDALRMERILKEIQDERDRQPPGDASDSGPA